MRILAIDTSTQAGSAALLDNERVCAEISYQTKASHSEVLLQKIDAALKKAGFDIHEIEGIAVAIGPGSFTGLRIGLATAKGLAVAMNKPIIGVSTLEALVFSVRSHHRTIEPSHHLVPCINAYRGEVYATVVSGQWSVECSIAPEKLCEELLKHNGDYYFIGDGAAHYQHLFAKLLGKNFHLAEQPKFSVAVSVGHLARERFKSDDADDVAGLTPNYIRMSDAEIKAGG